MRTATIQTPNSGWMDPKIFKIALSRPVALALSHNQICGRPSRSLWLAICGALGLGARRVGSLALGSTATPHDGSEGGSLAEATTPFLLHRNAPLGSQIDQSHDPGVTPSVLHCIIFC